MEGVVDHTMRELLTRIGGISRCVTEFVRVTTHTLPKKVFYRFCPELHTNGCTTNGTPVYVQLLGGNPELMASSALVAANLGAPGIDINFGCPAKTVNRNDGGSVILKEPNRVFDIVSSIRRAVPQNTPVTAKIRLGFSDRGLLREISQAIFDANASELCIHARTKEDGYKPPAYWGAIAAISEISPIPIIANGEIWNVKDYHRCVSESACTDVMLGRGALSFPDLARQIQSSGATPRLTWLEILTLMVDFSRVTEEVYESKHVANRIKQWLSYLRREYVQADELFKQVKRLKWPEEIAASIDAHRSQSIYEPIVVNL
jgi:tRNA-dihydrouridine synthase C